MERKLSRIERIQSVEPIENADAIEKVRIKDWYVVSKKGEFQVGDLCVYCEIDSVFPEREEFEFLRKVHFRIKTIRLRGQWSQGIVFPLDILGPVTRVEGKAVSFTHAGTTYPIEEGMEVTDILGITKYEPPVPTHLAGKVKGPFPSFLIKTDEERIQNLGWVLKKYQDTPFYTTEKLDGSSCTMYWRDDEFGVCSRNLHLLESDANVFWKLARSEQIEEKLKSLGKNIALQGEAIGEGIQGNKYKLRGQAIYYFSAFDVQSHRYLDFQDFFHLIEKELALRTVPLLDSNYRLPDSVQKVLDYAEGYSVLHPKTRREGIVFRPLTEITDAEMNGRLSFKAISNTFLLKCEE